MTREIKYKYVFGPVPSRRLGRSLGLDLVKPKTCTLDCVYCQVGRTTRLTLDRKEYVPTNEVIAEVEEKLHAGAKPDAVTFSGSGEPTLHSGIGDIIGAVKKMTHAPIVVLTNGTLLSDENLRRELFDADVVMPSLDAFDEPCFRAINRPHRNIDFNEYVSGLAEFAHGFNGKLLLEIFFVKDINDSNDSVEKLKSLAGKINPDEIHLNTVVRPVPGANVPRISDERLNEIRGVFGPSARVIASASKYGPGERIPGIEELSSLIERRPITAEDAAAALDVDAREARKSLDFLVTSGRAGTIDKAGVIYYFKSK